LGEGGSTVGGYVWLCHVAGEAEKAYTDTASYRALAGVDVGGDREVY